MSGHLELVGGREGPSPAPRNLGTVLIGDLTLRLSAVNRAYRRLRQWGLYVEKIELGTGSGPLSGTRPGGFRGCPRHLAGAVMMGAHHPHPIFPSIVEQVEAAMAYRHATGPRVEPRRCCWQDWEEMRATVRRVADRQPWFTAQECAAENPRYVVYSYYKIINGMVRRGELFRGKRPTGHRPENYRRYTKCAGQQEQ
jgi:hypothetical protein